MASMKTVTRKTARSEKTSAPMMKTTKTKATTMSPTQHVSHDDIAARSYELYLARGGEAGHAEEDWLRAEAELNAR
jgi:hypothetical protein